MSQKNIIEKNNDTATFGTGCFWCSEAIFNQVEGVLDVKPGYAGGETLDPDYRSVCSGSTGHAEVVQIVYNTRIIHYLDLLEIFWAIHDPTTLNRQGADIGTQYRSVVFCHSDEQRVLAEKSKNSMELKQKYKNRKIVTQIIPLNIFYPAESYHEDYYEKNKNAPYCRFVIEPKLDKFRKNFIDTVKNK